MVSILPVILEVRQAPSREEWDELLQVVTNSASSAFRGDHP